MTNRTDRDLRSCAAGCHGSSNQSTAGEKTAPYAASRRLSSAGARSPPRLEMQRRLRLVSFAAMTASVGRAVRQRFSSSSVGTPTAEIYGVEELTSFMVTHVEGAEVYDVIVRVAFQLDLVILAPGAPVGVTRAEQQEHLPDEIRNDAQLVTSGPGLVALIESS